MSKTNIARYWFIGIEPTSWVITQVGLEFAWDGGGYTTTIVTGAPSAAGSVTRLSGNSAYRLLINEQVVFADITTLPAAVSITAQVAMEDPSDSSEQGVVTLTASTTVYANPAVTVTSPADGATIDSLPLTIEWSVIDTTGISGQSILVQGPIYKQISLDQSVRSYSFGPADGIIKNDSSYRVFVNATNGVGLGGHDQVSFSTHWAPPPLPVVTVTSDADAMTATITPTAGAGTPATDHFIVARVNADGTRWVIADDVQSGDSVTDPLPPVGVEYSYAITAVTEAGTTSVANVARTVESTAWALNFGANASEVITLVGNPKASYSLDQGGEAYHFADGGAGGGLPVWYGTTDRDESGTLSFDTMLWHDSDRLRELCRQYPVAWLRDPFGHRWRAHVQPKISHGIGEVWQVSINWNAVRWEEAW